MQNNNKEQLKYRAYRFSTKLVKFCSNLPSNQIYRILVDQLVRSATSIGANIIEAQAGSSKKDFAKFFQIALKSANETIYWLAILKDISDTNNDDLQELIDEAKNLANILGASVLTLKGKRQ